MVETEENPGVGLVEEEEEEGMGMVGMPSRPMCTSSTSSVIISGLVLIPDYLTSDLEDLLTATLLGPKPYKVLRT